MSLVGVRSLIATALTTVEGVKGYEYPPTSPRAGDAWPMLGPMDRADGTAFYVTWNVAVFLPQDQRAAAVWIDEKHEALVDALESAFGFVDRIEPVLIGTDQYGLQITMRGES